MNITWGVLYETRTTYPFRAHSPLPTPALLGWSVLLFFLSFLRCFSHFVCIRRVHCAVPNVACVSVLSILVCSLVCLYFIL